jgi:hypothetical protein
VKRKHDGCLAFCLMFAVGLVFSIPASAQNLLQITSPATVSATIGSTFTITFSADPSVANIALVSDLPGIDSSVRSGNSFAVSVPISASIEQYQVSLIGSVQGQLVASDPITVTTDTSVSITSFQASPGRLFFSRIGEVAPVLILATLSDGSKTYAEESPKVKYTSSNAGVASVDQTGNVTAVSAGTATISISVLGAGQYSLPVVVPAAPVASPVLSPSPGTYPAAQVISLSDTSIGASIYYTVDGSPPTENSTLYTGPFTVTATAIVNALAAIPGMPSSVTWGTYVIVGTRPPAAAPPTFSPAPGPFTAAQTVTISDATPGASIYYTTNGTAPTASSTLYSGPLNITSSETIQAIAVASGYTNSPIGAAAYTINIPMATTPVFAPLPGTFTSAQTVVISDATAGATIYYTTNGSVPTSGGTQYTSPITVSSTQTIQAIAVASGYATSAVGSALYTIALPQDFSMGLSSSELTVSGGQSGSTSLTVNPINGFNQQVSFACSGLPTILGLSCKFAPATLTPNGSSLTTMVTIQEGTSASLLRAGSGLCLASVFVLLVGFRRKYRIAGVRLAGVLVTATVAAFVLGCGSVTRSTVTVTATSGSLSHTSAFTLTIK